MNKSNFYFTFAMNIMPATLLSVLPIGGLLLKNGTLTPEKFVLIVILSMGLITPIIGCIQKFFVGEFDHLRVAGGPRPRADSKNAGRSSPVRLTKSY